MEWWLLIPVVLVGGLVLDRLLVRLEARGWIYYRRRGRGGAAAGAFGELMDVFQPGRQITVAETRRRQERVQHADSGAAGDVDLDANRITLSAPPEGPGLPRTGPAA